MITDFVGALHGTLLLGDWFPSNGFFGRPVFPHSQMTMALVRLSRGQPENRRRRRILRPVHGVCELSAHSWPSKDRESTSCAPHLCVFCLSPSFHSLFWVGLKGRQQQRSFCVCLTPISRHGSRTSTDTLHLAVQTSDPACQLVQRVFTDLKMGSRMGVSSLRVPRFVFLKDNQKGKPLSHFGGVPLNRDGSKNYLVVGPWSQAFVRLVSPPIQQGSQKEVQRFQSCLDGACPEFPNFPFGGYESHFLGGHFKCKDKTGELASRFKTWSRHSPYFLKGNQHGRSVFSLSPVYRQVARADR